MWLRALFYISIATLFYFVGTLFAGPAKSFIANSEPATLIVLQVDERRKNDGGRTYRPVFGLETDVRPRPEYAGSIWASPKPHQPGDIVAGRYNPRTGEMRSDKMAKQTIWIGRAAQFVGFLLFLQGILMFFGFRELIPIRFRSGRRRGLFR